MNNSSYATSLLVCLLIFMAGCQEVPFIKSGKVMPFNQNWEYSMGVDSNLLFNDHNQWKSVTLPHTARLEPLIVNDQWQGICWYRKQFKTPENHQDKRYFLKFDGAMMVAEVWVNGEFKMKHLGGYLPFSVDISDDLLHNEINEVLVRLDNRDNPITGPKPLEILDFNTYGGLYREVSLIEKNPIYISDPLIENLPASGGVFVQYLSADSLSAEVLISTHVRNSEPDDQDVHVLQELWHKGQLVSKKESGPGHIPGEQAASLESTIIVNNPELWSPDNPALYKLITTVIVDGFIMDRQELPIGIKHIEFRNNQLFLNGSKRFLRGVNRHQEYPYIGYALSKEAQYRDAIKIKEAGFDYVRLSHYPHAPAFMKACDEIGLLVIDAILGWQYFNEEEAFKAHIYQTARDLIRRDRNHACVLAWEVSLNESWMPEEFIDSLTSIAHTEYPGDQCFTAGWQEYGYDIYLQARQHRLKHYAPPTKPYVVSEYGDWEYYAQNAGLNQDSWAGLKEEERTSRQLLGSGEKRLLQQATNIQEAHNDNFNTPAFADGYWVMFDYNRGYADDLESSGIMSINRIPKFSYFFYQSQRDPREQSDLYASGPMVYIASYWHDSSSNDIRIFSNCEEVELYLNDSLLGKQFPDDDQICNNLAHPPFTFKTGRFVPGTLVAKGYINGQEKASYQRSTTEGADHLILWIDESGKYPRSGVNDVVFVHAAIVDEVGTIIPSNDLEVSFTVLGDARLVSPSNLKTEAGIASSLIRIGTSPGTIQVKSEMDNGLSGEIQFQTK